MAEWISVKDRLPENNKTVLGCYIGGDMEFLCYFNGEFISYDEDFYPHKAKDVTHWMPLPEPPKREVITRKCGNCKRIVEYRTPCCPYCHTKIEEDLPWLNKDL